MKFTLADTPSGEPSRKGTAPSLNSLNTPKNYQRNLDDVTPAEWDAVTQPRHYKKAPDAVECINAIRSSMDDEQFKGYLKGNVQKYVWRYETHPNGKKQSLEKAAVYLQWLIEAQND